MPVDQGRSAAFYANTRKIHTKHDLSTEEWTDATGWQWRARLVTKAPAGRSRSASSWSAGQAAASAHGEVDVRSRNRRNVSP